MFIAHYTNQPGAAGKCRLEDSKICMGGIDGMTTKMKTAAAAVSRLGRNHAAAKDSMTARGWQSDQERKPREHAIASNLRARV